MEATKKCPKCQTIKSISEFHKCKSTYDGVLCHCKSCRRAYRQSDRGKVSEKRYRQSEKGKANNHKAGKKHRKTEKGKITNRKSVRKYQSTEKGKVVRREALKRFFARNPNQYKAKNAVNNAVRDGKLPRPNTRICHYCPNPAQQYHHWHGYEPEHWLDVIPVCRECHQKCKKKIA